MSTKPLIFDMTNGTISLGKETIPQKAVHIISLPDLVIEAEADEEQALGRIKARVRVKRRRTRQDKTLIPSPI